VLHRKALREQARARLSFTDAHGSMISSLAATSAPAPSVTLFRNTIGVLPGGPTHAFASRGGNAALRLQAAATCPLPEQANVCNVWI